MRKRFLNKIKAGMLSLAIVLAAANVPMTANAAEISTADANETKTAAVTPATISDAEEEIIDEAIEENEAVTTIASGYIGSIYYKLTSDGALSITGSGSLPNIVDTNPWDSYSQKVKKITVGSGITRIGSRVFADLSNVTSISLPATVTSIGDYAFEYCTSLTSITLPDNVTDLGSNAFFGCYSLNTVKLSKKLKAIKANTFTYTGVATLDIPSTCTTIESSAFYKSGITTLYIPDSVTTIGSGAFNDSDITYIRLPGGMKTVPTNMFMLCRRLKVIELGYGITTVKDDAFEDLESLEEIYIPCSVKSMKMTEYGSSGFYEAFGGCYKLAKIHTVKGSTVGKNLSNTFGDRVIFDMYHKDENKDIICDYCSVSVKGCIKGICQLPYAAVAPGQSGYLIGIETFDNPNQSYQYEMLIFDCTANKWVYSSGKFTVSSGCAGWTVWQPQYGYYWTLFRVYDKSGKLLDEQCYGFTNT